jgi:hypothetical protein
MRIGDLTQAQAVDLAEARLHRLRRLSALYGHRLNERGVQLVTRCTWEGFLSLHEAGCDARASELVSR